MGFQFKDFLKQWPIKKVLSARDVSYSQIVLPRNQVEKHILPLLLPEEQNLINRHEQLQITVRDLDTMCEHQLNLWENGSSYVLTKGWNTAFVRRRGLEIGEEVGFCWDERLQELRFSVLNRPPIPHDE
ncbi:B3 domain-containing protein At2g33720-like [Telopea speciosissima]|uniref:B3 domain-containing protein At2g33720-like n=1 Tax=Telopea speciosissima TaxID=54955 RepID=UPI001CC5D2B6|nr:B3 domain-containing protein At2g33720-like [Telopea speciosissima]